MMKNHIRLRYAKYLFREIFTNNNRRNKIKRDISRNIIIPCDSSKNLCHFSVPSIVHLLKQNKKGRIQTTCQNRRETDHFEFLLMIN